MLTDKQYGQQICVAGNENQNTLLHEAAVLGNLRAVETLMDQRILAEAKNVESKTAVHLAALKGHAR